MIKIICVGKLKEKYLTEGVNDYLTRLRKYHKIELIELSDSNIETEANEIGSAAYNELVRIRKDFPDYTIRRKEIAKKENKKSFKGLTIDEMKRFLTTVGKEDLELFEKVCKIAENKQGKYAVIKKWFLNNYQEAYEKELENLKLESELAELEQVA